MLPSAKLLINYEGKENLVWSARLNPHFFLRIKELEKNKGSLGN